MSRALFTKILISAVVVVLLWLLLRFALPVLLPFALAAGLALSAESAVRWMQQRLHLPRPLATAIGISGVFLLFVTLVTLALAGLMRQLPRLTDLAPKLENTLRSARSLVQDWLLAWTGDLPGSIGHLARQFTGSLFSGSGPLLQPLMQKLPTLVTGWVGKLSEGLFGLITALIASYMLSARLPQIKAWLKRHLPSQLQSRAKQALHGLRQAFGGWLLAQGKLALVTFGVLAVGFFLLRLQRPLLWAGLIALVDAFPVLGVGTVLLPWSFLLLLQGQTAKGIGMLAVYGISWLLRSVLEPRWVGKGIGLDPLLTLAAIYTGFCLGGFPGMLLAPILAMGAGQLIKAFQG